MTRYRIVPERSRVSIDARSSLHPIHSSAEGLEGYVDLELGADGQLNPAVKPTGRLSFPTNKLSSGNRLEDRELYKRIDIRRYPTIEGVLGEMVPAGDRRYRVSGDVTFKGVARHQEDEMTVDPIDDRTIRLQGKSRFDIRDYGMEPPRVLAFRVEPEVDVQVDIVAERERDPAVHELGLCSSIVEAIERRAGERPVACVRVRVGRLHHVHVDAFEQSFAIAALGTIAQDATADLVLLPVRARCARCSATWECEDVPLACPYCNALETELIGGDELVLESIQYRA